jgi:hypothetical protein
VVGDCDVGPGIEQPRQFKRARKWEKRRIVNFINSNSNGLEERVLILTWGNVLRTYGTHGFCICSSLLLYLHRISATRFAFSPWLHENAHTNFASSQTDASMWSVTSVPRTKNFIIGRDSARRCQPRSAADIDAPVPAHLTPASAAAQSPWQKTATKRAWVNAYWLHYCADTGDRPRRAPGWQPDSYLSPWSGNAAQRHRFMSATTHDAVHMTESRRSDLLATVHLLCKAAADLWACIDNILINFPRSIVELFVVDFTMEQWHRIRSRVMQI